MSDDASDATRRRGRRRAAAGAAVLAVVVGAYALRDPGASDHRQQAPRFVAEDLVNSDESVRLADFLGRPVVLNFWASWCTPCLGEMPALQAVHGRRLPQVAFLGINHQDDRASAIEVLEETGVTYPSAFDPDGNIARGYGVFGMPTTVFITADGRIVDKHTGELTEAELNEMIEDHFGGQQ